MVELAQIPFQSRSLQISPDKLSQLSGIKDSIFLPRTLAESMREFGFSSNLIKALRDPRKPLRPDSNSRTLLKVTEQALKHLDPEYYGELLSQYLMIHLHLKGFKWKYFPIEPIFSDLITSDPDLPDFPEGFGLENAAEFIEMIKLHRALSRVFPRVIPNLEFLLKQGLNHPELADPILKSLDPVQMMINSELAFKDSDYFKYLLSHLKLGLETQ